MRKDHLLVTGYVITVWKKRRFKYKVMTHPCPSPQLGDSMGLMGGEVRWGLCAQLDEPDTDEFNSSCMTGEIRDLLRLQKWMHGQWHLCDSSRLSIDVLCEM